MTFIQPRLKPVVEFCSIHTKIYFFQQPGIAVEMNDPSGFIAATCKLMDGKKNLDQLLNEISIAYPNEASYLPKLLLALDKEYLLEDEAYNDATNFTPYEKARWSRNIEFFGSYCKAIDNKFSFQEKLKAIKVTILGLGGVGSNVLTNLVAMGVTNIKAVDFDKVELSNLNRQILYHESDIGRLKSDAAKNRVSEFITSNIEFINKKISSALDVEEVIQGQDILIAAIDYPREKVMDWINKACVTQNTPFLCGSLDSKIVSYYTIIPGKTGCIECWKSSARKSGFIFQDIVQTSNFVSANSPNIAIMPFISLVCGFLSSEFLKIATGIAEPHSLGKLCIYDFFTSKITSSESWEINPYCSICSHLL